MRVQWGLIGLLWFVETEFVIPTVLGTRELLNQEHNCIVENPQHPQTVRTCRIKGTRVVRSPANRKPHTTTEMPKLGNHSARGRSRVNYTKDKLEINIR